MISDKNGLEHLSRLLIAKEVKHIVFSPGSRNAPLMATFPRYTEFECYSVVDERSAAFFALGIAQKTGETVVLSCTSGSALLNYAPALAEAYYQKVPLLVISADRPENLIDRGESQTIRQQNIYANYIKKSVHLPENPSTDNELTKYQELALEAIEATQQPDKGPAHINIPFAEPIYGQKPKENPSIIPIQSSTNTANLLEGEYNLLAEKWNNARRKMILVGQQKHNLELEKLLESLCQDPSVIVLSESTSNISSDYFVQSIDKVLATIPLELHSSFLPDLLISISENIVSKKIKAFLRTTEAYDHWDIEEANKPVDTYFHLTKTIPVSANHFFNHILSRVKKQNSDFQGRWLTQKAKSEKQHEAFLQKVPYSDWLVFDQIIKHLPDKMNVHFANSTPVRYSQLFNLKPGLQIESNRGTSGIDGSISTAVGAAWVSREPTVVVSGDLSFFYDSNALWNHYLSPELRIIVINNQGGGIFRFIEGPDQLPELETFFETTHQRKAESLAKEAGLSYFSARSTEELKKLLPAFFEKGTKAKLLEIFTPRKENAQVLKDYFKSLA